jgi:hypothetical protein
MATMQSTRPLSTAAAAAVLAALLTAAATAAPPQVPAPQVKPAATAAADSAAQFVAAGRAALKSGKPDEAVVAARRALRAMPGHREATSLEVDGLVAASRLGEAYDAYDTFLRTSKREDEPMLRVLSVATLQELRSARNIEARIGALGGLAEDGDQSARDELSKMAESESESDPGLLAVAELIRLGDKPAIEKLRARATSAASPRSRLMALDQLSAIDPVAAGAGYRTMLAEDNPGMVFAGARGVGRCRSSDSIPQLRALLESPVLGLQVRAAASLAELGDPAGRPILEANLSSEVAELRLIAAAGLRAYGDARWTRAVQSELGNQDLFYRLEAAEMLLGTAPAEARRTLVEALKDPNPLVRERAAKVLAAQTPLPTAELRSLFRDPAPVVRARAAAGLLRRPPAPASRKAPDALMQAQPPPMPAQPLARKRH